MEARLEKDWLKLLANEIAQPYFTELREFISNEKREQKVIYPPEPLIFNAFNSTPFDSVKVVIVGQDPYHGPGQAHGLSFSVPGGISLPPSLKNIYLELQADLGIEPSQSGDLSAWAKQGVLLLNASLTVRAGEPGSHAGRGWERFTDAVVECLIQSEGPIVFLLWGKSAQEKLGPILHEQKTPHVVLTAAHPSPFSAYRGFFGCRHFSKVNELLEKWGKEPIDWRVC